MKNLCNKCDLIPQSILNWYCQCGEYNMDFNVRCQNCGMSKPMSIPGKNISAMNHGIKPIKRNEWKCIDCLTPNNNMNLRCSKCKKVRADLNDDICMKCYSIID